MDLIDFWDSPFYRYNIEFLMSANDSSTLVALTGIAILAGIIFVILFSTIWFTGNIPGIAKWLEKCGLTLRLGFITVFILGFLVYDVGMCTGEMISLFTNAPMALLYAFKIFLFDSDVSEIHNPFHESWVYSFFFALVHFLAAIISTLFLIKYFGFNIVSRIRMWCVTTIFGKSFPVTYVFWGINESSYHLIEDIKNHYKKETEDTDGKCKDKVGYRIIIIRTNNDNNDTLEEKTGFARIFDFLSMPTGELARLQDTKCLTDGTFTNLSEINVQGTDTDIIGKILKMRSLKKILEKKTSKEIHMLFLSDDEKSNLHNVSLMLNDSTINGFVNPDTDSERRVFLYCHARYNSVHRVIEDQFQSGKIEVKVVDTSHINVEMLKQNDILLPVNFVDVEADATVSSPFNALVVGFSEVGQDSVRFLYEFGAFVKTGTSDTYAKRSDFHMHVVDKNMSDLAGTFVANAPAIRPSMPFIKNGENPSALITLHEMDCRSVEFYVKLEEWLKTLNYVVVATDNDELNISLGVRIFKAAIRYRQNMDKFCILVRTHSDDDGHIDKIASHYNRLWAAYESAPSDGGKRIHQSTVRVDEEVKLPIHIFGLDSNTFTFDNIIAGSRINKAKDYKTQYERTISPDAVYKISAWDDCFREIMQLDDPWKGFSPTYFGMMNLRRSQSQDYANCEHEATKLKLAQAALAKCGRDMSIFSRMSRESGTIRYVWNNGEEGNREIGRIAIVIAQTEHLRWEASHEILGYVYDDTKDEVRLRHNCLTNWENLSEYVRSYDCNVSDFILGIKITPCRTKK